MHEKMGYFNGFKFGVPVVVLHEGTRILTNHEVRLVYECNYYFIVLIRDNAYHAHSMQYSRDFFKYIPIPHSIDIQYSPMKPRFPVCSNRRFTAYCYKGKRMAHMSVEPSDNVREIT